MKVDTVSYPSWPDGTLANRPDNARNPRNHGARSGAHNRQNPARPAAPGANGDSSPRLSTSRLVASSATAAAPASSDPVDAEAEHIATQAVMANEVEEDMQTFNESLDLVIDDINQDRDTTDHMITAASAYNRLLELSTSGRPTLELQSKIDRLKTALLDSKGDEPLESIAQKANVDLHALSHPKDTPSIFTKTALLDSNDNEPPYSGVQNAGLSLSGSIHPTDAASIFAKYGKAPGILTRAIIFDEARFNNSAILKNTPLAALQRPGKSVLDPLGPNGKLGILAATRGGAAGTHFAKGGLSFLSGMEKLHQGKNPTDDFIIAGTNIGQGINEITVGMGTDLGNHLVKLQQAKTAASIATKPSTAPSVDPDHPVPGSSGTNTGTAEAVAEPRYQPEFDEFGPHDKLDDEVDALEKNTSGHIDGQLDTQQKKWRDDTIGKLENTHPDVQQLKLKEWTQVLAPQYFEMQHMADGLKDSAASEARDAHENIKTIDAKAQDVIAQLKNQGFATADAARQSNKPEAIELCKQLDQLADLKRGAYDQFNSAMLERDNELVDSVAAFSEFGRLLKDTPAKDLSTKLHEWTDKYREKFEERQASFLKSTDSWPEWMKISKPLRMQLIPSAINTVLSGASFGASLDAYLKKEQAGTATLKDRLDLSSSVVGLVAGIVGFVPVVGPIISLGLAVVSFVLGGLADQHAARMREGATYNLQEKIRAEYNAQHPGNGIAEPFDGG